MFRNKIQRFMYGRYGRDELNLFLIGLYFVLYVPYLLTRLRLLSVLGTLSLVFVLFRALSRNFPARRSENARFLKVAGPTLDWLRLRRTMHQDKEHRYFTCPSCGQHLRVPRGKGRITVTCRSCGASFQEKS